MENVRSDWPEPTHGPKSKLLFETGFTYEFDRAIFVKRTRPRKVIALLWVERHDLEDLRRAVLSVEDDPEFYFGDSVLGRETAIAKKLGW